MNPFIKLCLLLFTLAVTVFAIPGCLEMPNADDVRTVSNKRDAICAFVDYWLPTNPELEKVKELCDAGEDLKTIAAAYAGCPTPDSE